MTDLSHLDALRSRLARENDRLATAKTLTETNFRLSQIASCEKEIGAEYKFLGIEPASDVEMSDDDLLRELTA